MRSSPSKHAMAYEARQAGDAALRLQMGPCDREAYLRQALDIELTIRCKRRQIENLNDLCMRVTAGLGVPGSSPDPHVKQDIIARIADMTRELGQDTIRLLNKKREIAHLIAFVRDPLLRSLLEYRYLCGMRWDEIAEIMHFTPRHLTRLHEKALSALPDVAGQSGASKKRTNDE